MLNVPGLAGRAPLRSRLVAVLRPFLGSPGRRLYLRLPPPVDTVRITGDSAADLEHCRRIADWALGNGYLAIRAPSAADGGGEVLAIYPENRPERLRFEVGPRYALNHGPTPLADDRGRLVQPVPATLH